MKAISGFTRKGKLPVILQAERSECGLACLAMLLGYHGHQTDLHTLRNHHGVSQHGVTLKGMMALAAGMQLSARPVRLELHDLGKLTLPAVLHWNLDHFVVLQRVGRRALVIHDPAVGRRVLSWEEVDKAFTGVALECVPAPAFTRGDARQRLTLGEIWSHTSGLSGSLLQLLSLSFLLQGFALAMPFYTQLVIDDAIVNGNAALLKLLAAGFLLLVIFRQLTELLRAWIVMYVGNRISMEFGVRLCRHLLALPHTYFVRRHLGDIVSRFGSLDKVRDFLCSGLVSIAIDGVMVTITLGFMLLYSTRLTLIALAAVAVYLLVRLASYPAMRRRQQSLIHDRALENTVFMENVRAIQPIKLFGREAERLGNWQNQYMRVIASGMRLQKLGISINVLHGLLAGIETVVVLLVGALAVMAGELTLGMLMAFVGFKDHFFRAVFTLVDKGIEFRLLGVDLERLADMAYCEPEAGQFALTGTGTGPDTDTNTGTGTKRSLVLSLKDVSFSHEQSDRPLFANISLTLEAGTRTVIIGPTGCGKTTLLNIIAGLILPSTGEVRFNGQRLGAHNLRTWRAQLGAVMQSDTLLSGSLLENITFFDPSPNLDRVALVTEQALIAQDIARLPMQWHTMVGNMGAALSGGQVQRLLLARALYRAPAFLLLDEATSHLDIETEHQLNGVLGELGITSLVVAHRPETVLQADRILCLHPDGLVPLSHRQFRDMASNQVKDDSITI